MADRFQTFDVTVPTGTLQASPQRTSLAFQDGIVTDIEVLIPPGPSGFVGFRFDYGGQQIIPYAAGTFVIASGEVIKWPVSRFPTGRKWELVAFNTDIYNHTLHLRFLITELSRPVARLPEPIVIPIPDSEPFEPGGIPGFDFSPPVLEP